MKNCDKFRSMISACISGEASAESELFQHLETCDECQALFDEMLAVSGLVGELAVPAPENLAEQVMAAVEREGLHSVKKRSSAGKRRIIGFAVAAAAVIALVFIGSKQLSLSGRKEKTSEEFIYTSLTAGSDAAMDTSTSVNNSAAPESSSSSDSDKMSATVGGAAGGSISDFLDSAMNGILDFKAEDSAIGSDSAESVFNENTSPPANTAPAPDSVIPTIKEEVEAGASDNNSASAEPSDDSQSQTPDEEFANKRALSKYGDDSCGAVCEIRGEIPAQIAELEPVGRENDTFYYICSKNLTENLISSLDYSSLTMYDDWDSLESVLVVVYTS